jgi:plastocyanin
VKRSLVVAIAGLILLSACAGEDPTATSPEEQATASPSPQVTMAPEPECADLTGEATARIVMDDVYFDPRCAIVSGDQKLEFVNEGKSRHSFTIPELDFDVLSGKTKTTEQPIGKVLKPGDTYAYVCKYHRTMKGELRVQ